MAENSFGMRDMVGIVKQLSRQSQNRIVLKMTGTILTVRTWETKDHEKNYNYQIFVPEYAGVIEFGSKRVFPVGKQAEVVLTLIQFRAFEDVR